MIDLYYAATPNGHKITLFLEEANIDYTLIPVNIRQGEQFKPEFLKIAPNNRIPAIVDHAPTDHGKPISLFESGAILLYLADKLKLFIPNDLRGRTETLQWLFWQMAGLGPMLGQNHHFTQYAPEVIPYAIDRYVKETTRLYTVLNKQLTDREFIATTYSIADMACYPWILNFEKQRQNINDFPNLKRWLDTIGTRPAVRKAYAIAETIPLSPAMTEKEKQILFGSGTNAKNS